MREGDAAAIVTQAGLAASDALCQVTLSCFVQLLGSQAGNLALTSGATGGIYIAGGIAPRILSLLREGEFLNTFCAKGKMTTYLRAVPVHVVTAGDVGLRGAAQVAKRLIEP